MLLFLHIVCCFSFCPFPSSPFTLFLRSSSAFYSFVLHLFLSVLPSSLIAFYLSFFPLSTIVLSNFLFPLFGCLHFCFFFFSPRISLLTPSRSLESSSPLFLLQRSQQLARRQGRSQSRLSVRDPSCPAGKLSRRVRHPNAARRARPGTCVPGGAHGAARPPPSGWDQRSQANCFSLSPNCGFYQESLFQRAQTRSSADSLISSTDPHTPPCPPLHVLTAPTGRRLEPPGHSAEAREAPAGRRRVGRRSLRIQLRA